MKEKLEEIKNVGLKKIENVTNISELEEVRKELTGKRDNHDTTEPLVAGEGFEPTTSGL